MQATNDIVAAAEQLLAAVDATLAEVAKATGIARSTLDDERRAGRLRAFLPPGKQRGLLVRCEWFDEWFEQGSSKVRVGGKR